MRAFLSCLTGLLLLSRAALANELAPEAARAASLGVTSQRPATGRFVKTMRGYMVPYRQKIPGTEVEIQMEPVPGGEFVLGSPDSEPGRKTDEGPVASIAVAPFWIGKYEMTWSQYKPFMRLYQPFKQLEQLRSQLVLAEQADNPALREALAAAPTLAAQLQKPREFVDAITCPTPLYEPEATYESGEDPQLPAVTMMPYAARQYTKWLSRTTGLSFRLPSEAEWEYAARAGSHTAYHFGDSVEELGDYAWYAENSDDRSRLVGQKKPNAWGLFDMHGNVGELVLDQYSPDGYERLKGDAIVSAEQAINWPTESDPRVVRGGSWLDEPEGLRSAARLATDDEEWKVSDPNLPLSPWWFTELYPAGGVGFRIMRPLEPMSESIGQKAWEIDAERIQGDVDARLEEGRAAIEAVDAQLPEALQQLGAPKVQALLE